jgi:hypothetical protein
MSRLDQIERLVDQCECAGLNIVQHYTSDRLYLQVTNGKWHGRKWMLSAHMTDGEVVQTVMAAVLAWYEHEAREAFKFRGKQIFSPHLSLQALCERAEQIEVRP